MTEISIEDSNLTLRRERWKSMLKGTAMTKSGYYSNTEDLITLYYPPQIIRNDCVLTYDSITHKVKIESLIDSVTSTLEHEYLHAVLRKTVGKEVSGELDNPWVIAALRLILEL
ncbi:MAG: hypothetical protein ABSG57_11860 [Candidatus Bathyarchaeia archaeon]